MSLESDATWLESYGEGMVGESFFMCHPTSGVVYSIILHPTAGGSLTAWKDGVEVAPSVFCKTLAEASSQVARMETEFSRSH